MNQKPFRSGGVVSGVDWARWSVILCKPDAGERGLTGTILHRLSAPDDVALLGRLDVTVAPWQIHVHYWDLLVDRDWFSGRDIPAALDHMYVDRTVTVALAYGPPGIHARLRKQLGHFDPTAAKPGTIRGDLGEDSLDRALAEKRLVNNLVHTSDDPEAACRDFGTWYGSGRRSLLTTPTAPHQRTTDRSEAR
ncbi:nucleoside-diphosphate kinase [Streptomyces wuyuanensis]|uniref:nucleoside-diphosphate kinase n=1 Tax=Streptomyces wuyuanensis TaxID=1196353 RepID=UPI003434BA9E